jgi:fermentation-respiration switch protein FrsA (DUF1100 family)
MSLARLPSGVLRLARPDPLRRDTPMTRSREPAARTIVRIPTRSGDSLEAWLYLPEGEGPHPVIVMGHGIGAIKACGLASFAERFQRDGFASLVFDYRHFGGSEGQPRELLSFRRQREDYRTVLGWASAQPSLDPQRIIVWGTSFAGMYVVELAGTDSRLAAAIAQAPLVDGVAAARLTPPGLSLRLMVLALWDRAGSLLGRPPVYVPVAADSGETAIGAGSDARFGERLLTPPDGAAWRNRVTARSILSFCWRRPVRRAGKIGIPILLVVPEQDTVAPVRPAIRVTRKAPGGELHRSAGGHYDVYRGGASFQDTVDAEVEFLHRHFR